MNIRDYVQYLQKNCSQLDPELCQFYVDTYEKARFSTLEFTEEDYIHFMEAFHKLLKSFKQYVTFVTSNKIAVKTGEREARFHFDVDKPFSLFIFALLTFVLYSILLVNLFVNTTLNKCNMASSHKRFYVIKRDGTEEPVCFSREEWNLNVLGSL